MILELNLKKRPGLHGPRLGIFWIAFHTAMGFSQTTPRQSEALHWERNDEGKGGGGEAKIISKNNILLYMTFHVL